MPTAYTIPSDSKLPGEFDHPLFVLLGRRTKVSYLSGVKMLGKLTICLAWLLPAVSLLITVASSTVTAAAETPDALESNKDQLKVFPLALFGMFLARLVDLTAADVLTLLMAVSGLVIIGLYLFVLHESLDRIFFYIGISQVAIATIMVAIRPHFYFQDVIFLILLAIILVVMFGAQRVGITLAARRRQPVQPASRGIGQQEHAIQKFSVSIKRPNHQALAKADSLRARIYQKTGLLSDSAVIIRLDRHSH